MDWIKNFYDYAWEHHIQFDLRVHTHQDKEGTKIEVKSKKEVVVIIKDEDYENCHHRAYEALKGYVERQQKRIDEFLDKLTSEEAV